MKQGLIHGKTVADGWARAVMQKPVEIQNNFVLTYQPTNTARRRVACPQIKMLY